VTDAWWNDDDALLGAVRAALVAHDDVPASFVELGKASFAWRDIDAELAALSYDSAQDALAGASTRAEPGTSRYLTFDASRLSIELEIVGDVLHGQLVPAQAGRIQLRRADGTADDAAVNEVGYFTASPPSGRFRLHCRTADDVVVQTDWISL
jgi:hypothetical protein